MERIQNLIATLSDAHDKLEHGIATGFERVGSVVSHRPKLFFILSIIFIIASSCGIALIDFNPSVETAWIPHQSIILGQRDYMESNYGDYRPSILLLTHKNGESALTKEFLLEMLDLHERIMNITVKYNNKTYSYDNICYRALPLVPCAVRSVLAFWGYDRETLRRDNNPGRTVSNNSTITSSFQITQIEDVLGGIHRQGELITSAAATLAVYVTKVDSDGSAVSILWEKEYLNIVSGEFKNFVADRWTRRSQKDEVDRTLGTDAKLLAISVSIMVVYVSLFLGKLHPRHSKVFLGFSGVLGVMFSLLSGFGICGYFGVTFSELIVGVPFIVVGIGVDDMFIIVNAFERTHRGKTISFRMTRTLRDVGGSITMTSLTSVFAFFVGSNTSLPAMNGFCIFSGTCLLVGYILQWTYFAPLVIFDAMRDEQRRIDCVPCAKWKESPLEEDTEVTSTMSDRSFADNLVKNYYAPILVKIPVAIVVIVVGIAVAILGCVAASQLSTGLSVLDIMPVDSYVLDYQTTEEKYFAGTMYEVSMVIKTIDYTSRENQDAVMKLQQDLQQSEFVHGVVDCWLKDFIEWLPRSPMNISLVDGRPENEESFYQLFYIWMATAGLEHLPNIVFQNGFIKSSRMSLRHPSMASDIDKADAMEGIRAIADQSGVPAFPYTYMYLYWVQFVGLISKSVANFAVVAGTMKTMGGSSYYLHNSLMARFSVAGIFVILMVFLGNFWLSLIVLGNIVLIDMELLAVMYVWNINLTNVSIILLLLSIGLAVDSCAHIAHAFATSNEVDTRQRVIASLYKMGSSVFSGALTSFFGILVLGFSTHQILINMFKFFFSMFMLAMFHGLAFLPALLSFLPSKINTNFILLPEQYAFTTMDALDGHGAALLETGTEIDFDSIDPTVSTTN